MRPEIRLTPPRRARRRMAGFVIPETDMSHNDDRSTTQAYPGCYHEESYGDAWRHPFRDLFHLFHGQTLLIWSCRRGWVKREWSASGGAMKEVQNEAVIPYVVGASGCAQFLRWLSQLVMWQSRLCMYIIVGPFCRSSSYPPFAKSSHHNFYTHTSISPYGSY